MDKAKEFVEKLYNDDEFAKEVIIAGELHKKHKGMTEEESNMQIVNAAKKLGYNITREEYDATSKAYFESLGFKKSIKAAFRLVKLVKAVDKEAKKNK